MPENESTADSDFELAFNEATGQVPDTEESKVEVEEEAESPAPAEGAEEEASTEEASTTPSETAPPETTAPVEPDYRALFEKEQQRFKSLEGRFKAEMEKRKVVAPAPTPTPTSAPVFDDSAIKAFQEEFPDLAAPIKALVEMEAQRTTERQLAALREQELAPVRQAIVDQQAQAHNLAIIHAHPDAIEITESGDLKNWIETLPGFMQESALRVYENGSTTEVIDLYHQYKVARKPVTPNQEPVTSPQTAPQTKSPPLAVPGKPSRVVPKVQVDRGDFNAGWAAATKQR